MKYLTIILVVTIHMFVPSLGDLSNETSNGLSRNNEKTTISVLTLKNSTGSWRTSFIVEKKIDSATNGVNLDINQSIIKHRDMQYLRIDGVLTDVNIEEDGDVFVPDIRHSNIVHSSPYVERRSFECNCAQDNKLRFDSELLGKKAVLIKNGRAAYRKTPREENGAFGNLVTNRPLNDDELFEIQIEETIDAYQDRGLALGVVTFPPSDIGSVSYTLWKKRAWGLWRSDLHLGSPVIKKDYALDLRHLPEGARVGVMRKKSGDLHFFKNGHDMGAAAENVPSGVYGFVDLINDVSLITLVS